MQERVIPSRSTIIELVPNTTVKPEPLPEDEDDLGPYEEESQTSVRYELVLERGGQEVIVFVLSKGGRDQMGAIKIMDEVRNGEVVKVPQLYVTNQQRFDIYSDERIYLEDALRRGGVNIVTDWVQQIMGGTSKK